MLSNDFVEIWELEIHDSTNPKVLRINPEQRIVVQPIIFNDQFHSDFVQNYNLSLHNE